MLLLLGHFLVSPFFVVGNFFPRDGLLRLRSHVSHARKLTLDSSIRAACNMADRRSDTSSSITSTDCDESLVWGDAEASSPAYPILQVSRAVSQLVWEGSCCAAAAPSPAPRELRGRKARDHVAFACGGAVRTWHEIYLLLVDVAGEVDALYEGDGGDKRGPAEPMGTAVLVLGTCLMKRAASRGFVLSPENVRAVCIAACSIAFKTLEDEAPDTRWWSAKFVWWRPRCEGAFASAEGWRFHVGASEWSALTSGLFAPPLADEDSATTAASSLCLADDAALGAQPGMLASAG
jgi:hypothetical protein